jgi:hypothetical protein
MYMSRKHSLLFTIMAVSMVVSLFCSGLSTLTVVLALLTFVVGMWPWR